VRSRSPGARLRAPLAATILARGFNPIEEAFCQEIKVLVRKVEALVAAKRWWQR
jgi:hypothetical protein